MDATRMFDLIALANTCKRMGRGSYSFHKINKTYMLVFVTLEGQRHEIQSTASPERAYAFYKMMEDYLLQRNRATEPVVPS